MDEPRLLHRRSEFGYTTRPSEAAAAEPEAVDAETQDRLTQQAHARESQTRRQAFDRLRADLERSLEDARNRFGPVIANELRGMRRELDRMGSKLR